jgi:glycogen synthase kinase 3 beta
MEYRVEKIIGRGTFGVVYLTSSKNLLGRGEEQERYALKKVFQKNTHQNRELLILRRISHPNIIRMYKYFYSGETKEGRYLNIFCEYLPEDLSGVISSHVFRREELLMYARQALDALAFLHAKGIAHRDLKPTNILVDKARGVLKLCDFGSAKEIEAGCKSIAYICSRYYRSPENLLGVEKYSTKVDVWSLGCVLSEMVAKAVLFKGLSTEDQLEKILSVTGGARVFGRAGCFLWREDVPGIKRHLEGLFEKEELSDFIELLGDMLVVDPGERSDTKDLLERAKRLEEGV